MNKRGDNGLVKKVAYLVFGAESSGNHLVTDILINAGCLGHSGNHPDWHGDFRGWSDSQPWDERPPTDETPIVWRRSIPHGGEWIDIASFIKKIKKRGYEVTCVVVIRELHTTVESELKWHHVKSREQGRNNISRANLHIFSHLAKARVPYIVTSYEALVNYPEAQDRILEELGIPLPSERLETWDGNKKWYSES
jgi:hypothetical protein